MQANAIAMTTRCFMPPENWWGYSTPRSDRIPTSSRISLAFAVAALPEGVVEVMLLAGDLVAPDAVVDALAAAAPGPDGVVLEDVDGWAQLLAGRYRAEALRLSVDRAPALRDLSVRRLLGGLDLARVAAPPEVTQDVDTPSQARLAGVELRNYDGA